MSGKQDVDVARAELEQAAMKGSFTISGEHLDTEHLKIKEVAMQANPDLGTILFAEDPVIAGITEAGYSLPPISPYCILVMGAKGDLPVIDPAGDVKVQFEEIGYGHRNSIAFVKGIGVVTTHEHPQGAVDLARLTKENMLANLALMVTRLADHQGLNQNPINLSDLPDIKSALDKSNYSFLQPCSKSFHDEKFQPDEISVLRAELARESKRIAESGFTNGGGGNLSLIALNRYIIIKASGRRSIAATADDFLVFDLRTNKVVYGDRKPSSELCVHKQIYLNNSSPEHGVESVSHFHSPAVNGMGAAKKYLITDPMMLAYTPYLFPAGSDALSEAVASNHKKGYKFVIWGNHGASTVGKHPRQTTDLALAVEDVTLGILADYVCTLLGTEEAVGTLRTAYRFSSDTYASESTALAVKTLARDISKMCTTNGINFSQNILNSLQIEELYAKLY